MTDEKRPYRMRRRAALEAQTRLRITESAVELHEQVGPARTSISAIAERAGVRRSTVYRHFPDEEALFDACSSHWRDANPRPDAAGWAAIADPGVRTEAALRDLYAYYSRTHGMLESLLRDEALVPVVRDRFAAFHAFLRAAQTTLMAGRGLRGRAARRTRAAIGHALDFTTWRSLTQEHGLPEAEAVRLMSRLVEDAGRRMPPADPRRIAGLPTP